MNACLHTPTQKPGKGEKTHTHSFVGTHQTVPMKRKKGERGRKRDLNSVARREINCTARHKSKNKVSSLLSGVANVTLSAPCECDIQHGV